MTLTSHSLLEEPTPPAIDERSVDELRSEPSRPLGPQDRPAPRLTPFVAVVVALTALMAFAGTLAFDFVWDDTLLIQRIEDSLRLNPNQVNAVLNLALALAKLGRQEEAERTLERGLALSALMSPGNGWGYRVAAEIHGPKDPARAREWWERYIASVRSAPEQADQHRADVAYAERQIERIRGAAR